METFTIRDIAILTLLALRELPSSDISGFAAYSLAHLAVGDERDCIFFNNGTWFAKTDVWIIEREPIDAIVKEHPTWVYAYRSGGKDTVIMHPLPSPEQNLLYWVKLDAALDTARIFPGWATLKDLKRLIAESCFAKAR